MSTTSSAPRGFVPCRRTNGDPPAVTNIYPTGSNRAQIFIGDLLFLDANRKVQVFNQQTSANAAAALGVVAGLLDNNKKPQTHVTNKGIGVSAAGYVLVNDDPDTFFEVQCSASLGPSQIGHFAAPTSGAGNVGVTANGQSTYMISDTTVVTAAGHALQIYSLSPRVLDGLGGPNNKVIVRISNHVYRRSTRLQGPLESADA